MDALPEKSCDSPEVEGLQVSEVVGLLEPWVVPKHAGVVASDEEGKFTKDEGHREVEGDSLVTVVRAEVSQVAHSTTKSERKTTPEVLDVAVGFLEAALLFNFLDNERVTLLVSVLFLGG